jgi:ferrochelatase
VTLPPKTAIVLFNLGGPDNLDAVRPFLNNLFNDPAIIQLPTFIRKPLAWLIAKRRHIEASQIYKALGGSSPLLRNTQAQARALETVLQKEMPHSRVFIAMRYWHPLTQETVEQVRDFQPDHVVMLPLYPQFSTTTSGSSFEEWDHLAKKAGLCAPTTRICCYPRQQGFVEPLAASILTLTQSLEPTSFRVLFSAHGLPQKIVDKGDPYAFQVALSVQAVAQAAELTESQWRICYQSRVGPMKWLEPTIQSQLEEAARDGKGVIVVPIAFVSEHSETLYELDMEYASLATELNIPFYHRVSTPQTQAPFIQGLADLIMDALQTQTCKIKGERGSCPIPCVACPRQKATST